MPGIVLTASPEFVGPAMEEIRDLAPISPELTLLGEGVFFWSTSDTAQMVRLILDHPPIFLHHLHRASTWPFAGSAALTDRILQLLPTDLQVVPPKSQVALQGRIINSGHAWQPRELKQAVDPMLVNLGFAPIIKDPSWVISVTLAQDTVYYGVAAVAENLSDWSGGMVHFRKDANDISRSKFKLLEAINRWHLRLPSGGCALDLGAAPGGWTSVLLEHGMQVVAVDTGELDSRLSGRPRLTFLQQNVTELHLPAGSSFDLITCDMSWDPFFTVRTINGLVAKLAVGGEVLLTVKLMGKRPRQTVRQVMERLDQRLRILHAQHLFHNRQEITLHLQRKS